MKAHRLSKFNVQADAFIYKMDHPLTVQQFLEINLELPIYIMWINMAGNDKYSPELVGYYGYNNKSNGLWMGGEGGRAGTPWLSQMKEFVELRKVPRTAPVYDIACNDLVHTIQEIVVTHERIEIHIYDIDEKAYG